MVEEHSKAEDMIVLPALDARVPGISQKYHDEHSGERELFLALSSHLETLQCQVLDADESALLLKKVRVLLKILRDDMMAHLEEEEVHLWPRLVENFSEEEQVVILGRIFGRIPEARLREMLPWMIQTLSMEEQQSMMEHLLAVTKSTMFERWLFSWFPLARSILPEHHHAAHKSSAAAGKGKVPRVPTAAKLESAGGDVEESEAELSRLGLLNSTGRAELERAMRAIAQDSALSDTAKTRLMQHLMLSSWRSSTAVQKNTSGAPNSPNTASAPLLPSSAFPHYPPSVAPMTPLATAVTTTATATDKKNHGTFYRSCAHGKKKNGANDANTGDGDSGARFSAEELRAMYRDEKKQQLGCAHYMRGCKVVARCCGRLYACNVCHDIAESHAMDRYDVTEMMCMYCQTLQPVSSTCINASCNKTLGKYFCKTCNLWNDDPSRSMYHCHSCNVCRVGKGLGIDHVHCMKCNACVRINVADSHQCTENAIESDCPICKQYMFLSTEPIKYLRCGHLMHEACYREYSKTSMKCALCKKSMKDMSAYYAQLDLMMGGEGRYRMPKEYEAVRCDVECNECSVVTRGAKFHFLFNKCHACNSYNTNVRSVDPNAAARTPPHLELQPEPKNAREHHSS